jgi:hypothetical protein
VFEGKQVDGRDLGAKDFEAQAVIKLYDAIADGCCIGQVDFCREKSILVMNKRLADEQVEETV